jgi:DNA-binding response OmpR family regulator
MEKILIVEDNENIRTSLVMALEKDYDLTESATGEDAIKEFMTNPSDLILLDLMLPGISGFEAIRIIRATSSVPIIIVSARDATDDVVAGLELGADDYLTKPVEYKELKARIKAHLRRTKLTVGVKDTQVNLGNLEIDAQDGTVKLDGSPVSLTRTEFRLLLELANNKGKVFSREELLSRVWGYNYFGDSRLVDVHIRRLRAKLEKSPESPQYILTVRGFGYKLNA